MQKTGGDMRLKKKKKDQSSSKSLKCRKLGQHF